jgi:hypothetical protein
LCLFAARKFASLQVKLRIKQNIHKTGTPFLCSCPTVKKLLLLLLLLLDTPLLHRTVFWSHSIFAPSASYMVPLISTSSSAIGSVLYKKTYLY